MDIESEFRKYIKSKLKDKTVRMMVYACVSFKKQRRAIYSMMELHKESCKEIDWLEYITCSWADDLTRMYAICFPDFIKRFGVGISRRRIEEITLEEFKIKEKYYE